MIWLIEWRNPRRRRPDDRGWVLMYSAGAYRTRGSALANVQALRATEELNQFRATRYIPAPKPTPTKRRKGKR